jgi:hypothetical protein
MEDLKASYVMGALTVTAGSKSFTLAFKPQNWIHPNG